MTNDEQAGLWNETVGDAWVRNAELFDATLRPFGQVVIDALDLRPSLDVLDVGCGAGATTMQLAAQVGDGRVLGVDISARMLAEAERRAGTSAAANVTFRRADAQTDALGTAVFDAAFSRFGVMFFADPGAAFVNMARALVPGGQLGFICFQSAETNPFIVVPVLASAEVLELGPPPGPGVPGPFSLADPTRTTALLVEAGFTDIAIDPGPSVADLGAADDLVTMAERLLEQNPGTAPLLAAAGPDQRQAAIHAAAEALGGHVRNGRVLLGAGTWVVTAVMS